MVHNSDTWRLCEKRGSMLSEKKKFVRFLPWFSYLVLSLFFLKKKSKYYYKFFNFSQKENVIFFHICYILSLEQKFGDLQIEDP